MKKQFFRVKQLADQTFSRAGKTEVLSDDLQDADRRVDVIKNACQNTSKKMASGLLAQGQDAAATREKRLKKSPEYMLGLAMLECGDKNDDEALLGNTVVECGKLQMALANEVVEHEARVEDRVVSLLHSVSEGEVPNILKHKRNLAKLILDMDSARTRYQTALKHSTGQGGTSKVESIREELDDAELKVEQCRDQLASEMFQLISREAELAQTIVEYARLQRMYHEKALSVLDNFLPDLESVVNDSHIRPVFGAPLEDHLRVTSRKIAFPIELCVCALLELGMEEEGLFRVAGGSSKVKRMKLSLDAGCLSYPAALEYRDPHVVAGVLKSYLRELPEPLMTYSLYDEWMAAARVSTSNDARLQALWTVVQKLPDSNRDNLRYLVKFLAAICRNQDINKMSPQNIAIVIAPNLIWSPACGQDVASIGMNMSTANFCSVIVDCLVSFADWFFPGEVDFYVTLSREAASELLNGGVSTSQIGHTRNSSADAQLVDTSTGGDMHRTQSNSSLSDLNSSPPQGSPKPAARHKKKPAAPVPPVPANSNSASNTISSVSKASGTVTSSTSTSTVSSGKAEKPGKPPPPTNAPPINRPLEKPVKPPPPVLPQEKVSVCVNSNSKAVSTQREKTTFTSPAPMESSSRTGMTDTSHDHQQAKSSSSTAIGFEHFLIENNLTHSPLPTPNGGAQTASACDVDTIHCTTSSAGHVSPPTTSNSMSTSMSSGGTLERKRPQRPMPVAAPRTTLLNKSDNQAYGNGQAPLATAEDEFTGVTLRRALPESGLPDAAQKPAIPERPATLQRPLSSSFRLARPTSDPPTSTTTTSTNSTSSLNSASGTGQSENTANFLAEEQAAEINHSQSSSDKQQVSIVHVKNTHENVTIEPQTLQRSASLSGRPSQLSVHNFDKPDRPPKPEIPQAADRMSLNSQPTSHVANAEGGEFVLPSGGQFGSFPRPPRPQPPPPPLPVRPRADSAAESTDL